MRSWMVAPMPLKRASAAVLVAEEAQRRQHALDRADQRRRAASRPGWHRSGAAAAGRRAAPCTAIGLREIWPPSGRICRSSSSARWRVALRSADGRRRQRQRREGQRDAGAQPVLAVGHLRRHRAQIADLHRQRLQEGAVEREFGALQHHRGMLQPGDDALGGRRRLPGDAGDAAAVDGDPVRHQRARIGGGELGAGGAHVAQPAEAVQRLQPAADWRPSIWNGDLPPVSTRWPDSGKRP